MKKHVCFLLLLLVSGSNAFAQANPAFKKADSLFLAQNYALAKVEYETLLKTNQGTPLNWNRLASSCYITGAYDEAVTHFDKALSLNPPDQLKSIILERLAKTYGAKKDKTNMMVNLRKAIDAGFTNWNDITADPNLQHLINDPELAQVREILTLKLNPCMGNPKNRELDFWIGEWNVFDSKTNRPAGTNSILMASGGCMLLESWADISGTSTAKSMTYVNPENGKWEQIYVDNTGKQVLKFTEGVYNNGVMKFSITTKGTDGKEQNGEFVFEKKSNGEVRQYQQTTPDGGKTWNMVFDLTYRKK